MALASKQDRLDAAQLNAFEASVGDVSLIVGSRGGFPTQHHDAEDERAKGDIENVDSITFPLRCSRCSCGGLHPWYLVGGQWAVSPGKLDDFALEVTQVRKIIIRSRLAVRYVTSCNHDAAARQWKRVVEIVMATGRAAGLQHRQPARARAAWKGRINAGEVGVRQAKLGGSRILFGMLRAGGFRNGEH